MSKHIYHVLCFLIFHFESNCLKYCEEQNKIEFIDETGNIHYIDLAATVEDLIELNLTRQFLHQTVHFWLYTRENVDDHKELFISKEHPMSEKKGNNSFNPGKPLVLVTHGWMGNGSGESTQMIKDDFLAEYDANVIVVNWRKDASKLDYVKSAIATILVANEVNSMILSLTNQYEIEGKDMHLIGHSLGAHVMGSTGNMLKKRENFTVGRVTGLDPARPFFEFPKIIPGITSGSATFVDIIHTNSGILGYISAIGHADFYPNGGLWLPHCCKNKKNGTCAHACAYVYFAESISGTRYVSFKCTSYKSYLRGICYDNEKQLKGLHVMPTAKLSYYLNTSSKILDWLHRILKKLS